MQTQNRILDDLAKMASGAMSGLSGLRHEIEMRAREQIERILGRMDLVQREEFEAVKAMAAKAREEQELLSQRLAELENSSKPGANTPRLPPDSIANPESSFIHRVMANFPVAPTPVLWHAISSGRSQQVGHISGVRPVHSGTLPGS